MMKKVVAVLTVLAMASFAHGLTLSGANVADGCGGTYTFDVAMDLSGGQSIQSLDAYVTIEAAGQPATADTFVYSATYNAAFGFKGWTGGPVALPLTGTGATSPNIGGFAFAAQTDPNLGTLTVTISGPALITFEGVAGGSVTSTTVDGSIFLPEPATALCLLAGLGFIRRRR